MPAVKMLVSALTDVGRARTTNEDAFGVTDLASGRKLAADHGDQAIDVRERGVLLALSDGMGGHQAGEVASALVLESLEAALQGEAKGSIQEQLEEAVQRANQNVLTAAQAGNRRGMGATLTAVFVRGSEAYIAEVGDSRAYLLRNGRLRQITRDQSLVQLLVDRGVMSPEEAQRSPNRNVILQAVGLSGGVRVAIARLELRRQDRLLLCSDGVTNAVTDDELREIMTGQAPRKACEAMIALANERGGKDNQTAIVADLGGEGLELPAEFETVTSTYEVLTAFDGSAAEPSAGPEPATPDPADFAGPEEDAPRPAGSPHDEPAHDDAMPTLEVGGAAAPAPAAAPPAAADVAPADAPPRSREIADAGATYRLPRASSSSSGARLRLLALLGLAVLALLAYLYMTGRW